MKKTSYIFAIVLSAIASGVFFMPSSASAVTLINNNASQNADFLKTTSNRDNVVTTSVGCLSGDCQSAPASAWRTDIAATVKQGEFEQKVYVKRTGGSTVFASLCYLPFIVNGQGGNLCGSTTDPVTGETYQGSIDLNAFNGIANDSTWHYVYFSMRHGATYWELCEQTDAQDIADCSWTSTAILNANIVNFDGFGWGSETGSNYMIDTMVGPPLTFGGGTTRIYAQNSPTPGYVSSGTDVLFDFDYYNTGLDSPLYTKAGVQIVNDTIGLTYNTSATEADINASGALSYADTFVLLDTGDAFRWRPYLRTASSTKFLYGDWYSFSVVEQNPDASPFSPIEGGFGTSTASDFCDENLPYDDSDIIQATLTFIPNGICKAVSFMVVPSQASVNSFQSWGTTIPQKIPFSYAIEAYGIYNDLNTAISSSSTTHFPVLELQYGSTTSAFNGSVVLFSSSTVNALFPPEVRNNFRNLMSVVLWLSFAGYMMLLVKKLTMPVDLS